MAPENTSNQWAQKIIYIAVNVNYAVTLLDLGMDGVTNPKKTQHGF